MTVVELDSKDLRKKCDLSQFEFATTDELAPLFTALGAKRALEAIDFGLEVKQTGYNIFALNFCDAEEQEYITSLIKERALKEEPSDDLCYVYNFDNPKQPQILYLPAGLGKEFKDDMDDFLSQIQKSLKHTFSGDEFQKRKSQLKNRYKGQSKLLWTELRKEVEELGYILEREEEGFAIIPLLEDGDPMSEEYYTQLAAEEKEKIQQTTQLIQEKIDQVFDEVTKIREQYRSKVEKLKEELALDLVTNYLDPLIKKYNNFTRVNSYFSKLQEDILANLDIFEIEGQDASFFLVEDNDNLEDKLTRYKVNLVVDNSESEGAPVILETNPTYYNLVGSIEYDNHSNQLQTDLLKIKTGALQRANGGYLILEARKLLSSFKSWQTLKRVLKTGKVEIENLGQEYDKFPLVTLEPEGIECNLTIILLGSPQIYRLLYHYDPDFKKLFKIKADFDAEMERNEKNNYQLAQFIAQQCQEKDLRPLDYKAVAKVIEYSSWLRRDQEKLTTKFSTIIDLLYEADTIAKLNNKEIITEIAIKEVLNKREQRVNRYEEKIQELYQEDKILLETTGDKIGQINGLSVLDLGDYTFGRPSKITAAVYQGQRGVINIEREADLSGKIHDKGILILTAYLGEKFAQDKPLSLTASLCFEQMYSEIDGDSASSAELYTLLSALAQVPLRQDLAVTGSVNQQGKVQPVGGVTEKIEGFFRVCKEEGLTGKQGVLIPKQNKNDLMLKDEVIKAVNNNKFHIYTVSCIEEGIELLTGKKVEVINNLVDKRIEKWADESK